MSDGKESNVWLDGLFVMGVVGIVYLIFVGVGWGFNWVLASVMPEGLYPDWLPTATEWGIVPAIGFAWLIASFRSLGGSKVRKDAKFHDYRYRYWGHDYSFRPFNGGKQANATGWGRGIRSGDFFMMSQGEGHCAYYLVKSIQYYRDPSDMWNASLEWMPSEEALKHKVGDADDGQTAAAEQREEAWANRPKHVTEKPSHWPQD